MNVSLIKEKAAKTVRVLPALQIELRLEATFAAESFEVAIRHGRVSNAEPSPELNCVTSPMFDLLLTSKLTATESLTVSKSLKPS